MKVAVILCLAVAVVSAMDLRMCQRNCRMNDHYCKWTSAPGQTGKFCMQKYNQCQVGCIQMCKSKCDKTFTAQDCVTECQYRGQMMVNMDMQFDGAVCMKYCQKQAQACNMKCDDNFRRLGLQHPVMEYIYPEMGAEDWTVRTGLKDNPHQDKPFYAPRRRLNGY